MVGRISSTQCQEMIFGQAGFLFVINLPLMIDFTFDNSDKMMI